MSDAKRDLIALLAAQQAREPDFIGHYMANYVIAYQGEQLLARRARGVEDFFDPRMMREADALRLAASGSTRTPKLVYADDSTLVETYCPGERLDLAAPTWAGNYRAVIAQMIKIYGIDPSETPGAPSVGDWWSWLEAFIRTLWHRLEPSYGERYDRVGLQPLDAVWSARRRLGGLGRPTRLVHSDLHEANVLVADDGVWLLDWELALKADPLWDVAVSLHRSHWRDQAQRSSACSMWLDGLAERWAADDAAAILDRYTWVERWKSVAVDMVRYPRQIADSGLHRDVVEQLGRDLSRKLTDLAEFAPCAQPTPVETAELLLKWAADA